MIPLPDVSDWPHTTCYQCGQPKINGLFLPEALKAAHPVCRLCQGEVSSRKSNFVHRKAGTR